MLRIIQELQPTWVIGENVAGIISMGEQALYSDLESDDIGSTTENMVLEEICQSLENIGYEVQPVIIPAAGVGALHRRKRVFILGYSKHNGLSPIKELRSNEKASDKRWKKEQTKTGESERTGRSFDVSSIQGSENGSKQDVAYSEGQRCGERRLSERENEEYSGTPIGSEDVSDSTGQRCERKHIPIQQRRPQQACFDIERGSSDVSNPTIKGLQDGRGTQVANTRETEQEFERCGSIRNGTQAATNTKWWAVEPELGRVANGIPSRVDRLKCLGNAVVPAQAYPIIQAIADIEYSVEINKR